MSDDASAKWDAEQATQFLEQRLQRQVLELRVLICDGHVVLRGRAVTYYAKQLAQHVAMQSFRLPIRANEIEVSATHFQQRGEEET